MKSNSSNQLYRYGDTSKNQVALTFDDGPDMEFTPQVLRILKEHGIKATFFIVGEWAERYPDMLKQIAADGHAIGNHTWGHPHLAECRFEQVRDEIVKTEQVLDQILGFTPSFFRVPYGAIPLPVLGEIASKGYSVIEWSVDSRDWAGESAQQIMETVKRELKPGGIILQHCGGGKDSKLTNTLEALPLIISYLKQMDYKAVTIPELLNIPAVKA